MGLLWLRSLLGLVHALRLAQRTLDRVVGWQRMPTFRLAWLDSRSLEDERAVGVVVELHATHNCYERSYQDNQRHCDHDHRVRIAGCGC